MVVWLRTGTGSGGMDEREYTDMEEMKKSIRTSAIYSYIPTAAAAQNRTELRSQNRVLQLAWTQSASNVFSVKVCGALSRVSNFFRYSP